jgi:hypothetical protein
MSKSHIDDQIDPSLVLILIELCCMLCGQFMKAATMLIYDQCLKGWHMGCLMPPFDEIPTRNGFAFNVST